MRPTRDQVKTRYLSLLDDPSASVFTDAVFQEGFAEAYDALYAAFLTNQCPRITCIALVTVPAMTTALTPAQMGIDDFGDFVRISERAYGSDDKFLDLNAVDRLTQRAATDRLLEFCWRNDTFYFLGATGIRELEVEYETSGDAPTTNVTIGVDGCLTFLANYAAGVTGARKGYDEIARRCMQLAVGPKYDLGTVGGELFRIIQPRVRSMQHTQIAPKPFSSFRRILARRRVPYVAAQQGTTGGGVPNVPIQFSTADGTIVPLPDGTNTTFWLVVGVTSATVYWNGLVQTEGVDYTRVNNQIAWIATPFLGVGDVITAEAYTV
jgi:hypothetical protein